MANSDVFAALTKSTFHVELFRGGVRHTLEVRELPFSTLMYVLGEAATHARNEIEAGRKKLLDDLSNYGVHAVNSEMLQGIAMPILYTLVEKAPSLVERIMLDVIVDATPEIVKILTPEDIAGVLLVIIEHLTTQTLIEKAKQVFFRVREVQEAVVQEANKATVAPTSLSPSPSVASSAPSPE